MIRRLPLLAVLAAAPALAERPDDRTWLTGTAMFADVDTRFRLDREGFRGTEIGLERDVGLTSDKALPAVLGGVRIGRKWRAEFEFLRLSRSGSAVIGRPITIEDTTYDVNSLLSGRLRSDTYRAAVGYSFVRTARAELGVAVGAHITRFGVRFAGTGTVAGVGSANRTEVHEVTAPLPNAGLYGSYVLSPMFSLQARAEYVSLKVKDVKGELIDAQAGAAARVLDHVSLGAGYRFVRYDIRATKRDFRGKLNYRFDGPVVFAELAF